MKFYPLQFQPILKDRIWGGTKLRDYLNENGSCGWNFLHYSIFYSHYDIFLNLIEKYLKQ